MCNGLVEIFIQMLNDYNVSVEKKEKSMWINFSWIDSTDWKLVVKSTKRYGSIKLNHNSSFLEILYTFFSTNLEFIYSWSWISKYKFGVNHIGG